MTFYKDYWYNPGSWKVGWNDFKDFKLKLMFLFTLLNFLVQCKNAGVVPGDFRLNKPKLQNDADMECQLRKASIKLLNVAIRKLRAKIGYLEMKCYVLHQNLSFNTPIYEFERIRAKIEAIVKKLEIKRQIKFNTKFKHLKNKQKPQNKNLLAHNDGNKFVNISDIEIPEKFDQLIKFGPKFSPRVSGKVKDIIVDCELILKNVPSYVKPIIQGQLINRMIDHKDSLPNKKFDRLINEFKSFVRDSELKICKADKMGDMVLLSRQQFDQRIDSYIQETKCKPSKITRIDTLYRFFNKLSKNKLIINILGNIAPPRNYSVPGMFLQIKTHKVDFPARPLINCRNAPFIKFEKKFAEFVSPVIENSKYRVKSSVEFLNKLPKKLNNDDVLYTIDVVALFPSVPLIDAHNILISKLKGKFKLNEEVVKLFNEAIYHINNFNVFKINNCIYQQTQGLPMGSPMSPIYAEIYLQNIESKFFDVKMDKEPKFMARYVDDIFVVWSHHHDELIQLFNNISEVYPNLKFTINKEINKQIQFLDIVVMNNDGQVDTAVYRKQLPKIIPYNSFNFNKYKFAAFNSYFYRAFKFCSNQKLLKEEIDKINEIAHIYGFKSSDINKIKNRIQNKLFCINNIKLNREKTKFKIVGCVKFNEYTYSIKNILNKFKLDVIVKPNNNIFDRLRDDRDIKVKCEHSGVYKIPIVDQQNNIVSVYVGSSLRKISVRLKEHVRDYAKYMSSNKQNTGPTSLIQFLFDNRDKKFYPDFKNTLAIPYNNQHAVRIYETIEILSSNSCNSDLPTRLSWAWQHLIGRYDVPAVQNSDEIPTSSEEDM